jgi:hypothetical protein
MYFLRKIIACKQSKHYIDYRGGQNILVLAKKTGVTYLFSKAQGLELIKLRG